MTMANYAKVSVEVTGIDKVKEIVEDAMQLAFLAGFVTCDHLWQDSVGAELGGTDSYSEDEMVARYKSWRETAGKTREEVSEMALAKLRKKLTGASES